ncbi:TauD/TfdA family dioxygenase [Pseudofrankia sp. BMG5.37]|uniref:TauD/TfdA family dioxygenase n=1 Tax=Pseudofrankia sp. BMG5.37 TaxID=3050035 RepID=UPI0037C80985
MPQHSELLAPADQAGCPPRRYTLELKAFALQPRFGQEIRAEVDDVLIWDNWSVVHSATPTHYSDRDGERREPAPGGPSPGRSRGAGGLIPVGSGPGWNRGRRAVDC